MMRPQETFFSFFSRVLRDSTWHYVGPSVCLSVGGQFAFLAFFAILLLLPTSTRLGELCIRPCSIHFCSLYVVPSSSSSFLLAAPNHCLNNLESIKVHFIPKPKQRMDQLTKGRTKHEDVLSKTLLRKSSWKTYINLYNLESVTRELISLLKRNVYWLWYLSSNQGKQGL